ncbi:SIR2-like domain-containing protein [Candidatus Methanomarinus sp.]|nr:SIR2-like domain-containing protein [ANME-2 cluster archaeon]
MTSSSDFNDSQKKALEDMKDAYTARRLIPFIGSGFSRNVNLFPDWDKFIIKLQTKLKREVDKKISLRKSFSKNNIQATEAFVYLIGKKRTSKPNPTIEDIKNAGYTELVGVLKDEFANVTYDNSDPSWDLHRKFIKMFEIIYTTNWDDLLEKTYIGVKGIDQTYRPIINYENFIHFINDDKTKQIIKFHGDYRDKDSLIATESDYLYRIETRSFLDTKLINDFLHNSFLYMGFSFDDIFIKYMLFQLFILRGKNNIINGEPKTYMVSINHYDECKDAYFKSQGISVYYLFPEKKKSESTNNNEIRNKYLQFLKDLNRGN